MGPGVPYAIGAKIAHPERPVVALVGDGAMQMNNLAELITIVHYWRQWADPRLVVAVLHNNDLNQVTWEMRAMEGAPKFVESQTLPDVDFAAVARSFGLNAITVTEPEKIGRAWEAAFSADRPTLLDVHTDPDFPRFRPMPPSSRSRTPPRPSWLGMRTPAGVVIDRSSAPRSRSSCLEPRGLDAIRPP